MLDLVGCFSVLVLRREFSRCCKGYIIASFTYICCSSVRLHNLTYHQLKTPRTLTYEVPDQNKLQQAIGIYGESGSHQILSIISICIPMCYYCIYFFPPSERVI